MHQKIHTAIRKIRFDYWLRLWFRVLHALMPRKVIHSRSLSFSIGCDNWLTTYRKENFNNKDSMLLDWIDQYVENGSVFLNIGANIGCYSIYAALRHPKLSVIAVEPEYSNLHLLKENILANSLGDRILVFSIALGNVDTVGFLHIQDVTPGAAYHTVSKKEIPFTRAGRKVVWKEGIKTMTLDQFVKEIDLRPNFIKIDVDGTEKEILEGGGQTLSSPELRSIIIEIPEKEPVRTDCKRILADAGFGNFSMSASGANSIWIRR